jgi:hypothetical protein
VGAGFGLSCHLLAWKRLLVQWSCTWYEFVSISQFVALESGKPVLVAIAWS